MESIVVAPTATLGVEDKSNKERLGRTRIELLPLRHAWLPDRDRIHLALSHRRCRHTY